MQRRASKKIDTQRLADSSSSETGVRLCEQPQLRMMRRRGRPAAAADQKVARLWGKTMSGGMVHQVTAGTNQQDLTQARSSDEGEEERSYWFLLTGLGILVFDRVHICSRARAKRRHLAIYYEDIGVALLRKLL
ncbi:hypothetical protein Syun_012230 [Stephania yunnanensis]|uniref:Uncharacterized protein n=1 Tax=Stephania yunnanensis TaxID=152371 RepID=A0AAP0K1B6_9MAGN